MCVYICVCIRLGTGVSENRRAVCQGEEKREWFAVKSFYLAFMEDRGERERGERERGRKEGKREGEREGERGEKRERGRGGRERERGEWEGRYYPTPLSLHSSDLGG